MDLIVERVEVWAAAIDDRHGALATALVALRGTGADLDAADAQEICTVTGTAHDKTYNRALHAP